MHGPAPKQILMRIEHQVATLIQHILFTDEGGARHHQILTYKIGTETINSINGVPARSLAIWQEGELVIESWMKTPAREFHFKDHWSISDDRSFLTMAHIDDDLAGQTSVLERASEADAAEFDSV
jgi:hypothetical protein